MVKCKSLRINMFRITHMGKSVNFPVTRIISNIPGHHTKLFSIKRAGLPLKCATRNPLWLCNSEE